MEEKKVEFNKKFKPNQNKPFIKRENSERNGKNENFQKKDNFRNPQRSISHKPNLNGDFQKNKQFEQKEFQNKNKFGNDDQQNHFISDLKKDFKPNLNLNRNDDDQKHGNEETTSTISINSTFQNEKKKNEKKKQEQIQRVKAKPREPNYKWYKPPPFPYNSTHFDPERDLFGPLEETQTPKTQYFIDKDFYNFPQDDKTALESISKMANDLI